MLGATSVLRGLCLQSLCLRGLRLRGLPCEVYACEVFSIVLVLCEVFKRSLYLVVLMLCGAYAYEVYTDEVCALWRLCLVMLTPCEVSPSRFVPHDVYALWCLRLRSLCLRGLCLAPRLPFEVCPARSTLYGTYALWYLRSTRFTPAACRFKPTLSSRKYSEI